MDFIKPMLEWNIDNGYGVVNMWEGGNFEPLVRYCLLGDRVRIKNVFYIHGRQIEQKEVELKLLDMYNTESWVSMKDTYPLIQD